MKKSGSEKEPLFFFAIGVWGGVTEKRLLSIYVNNLPADYSKYYTLRILTNKLYSVT